MDGSLDLPGGRVYETGHWVAEHCVGPLGVGTLLLKPRRHCLNVGDLEPAEAAELGPALQLLSAVVRDLNDADQVYVCLWSHKDWTPVHIHFVIQPAWGRQQEMYSLAGPNIQLEMFKSNVMPDPDEVAAFCDRARARIASGQD
jgi:diadenosine tetraphosphate (Ap4A) HIT family hydrolase